MRAMAAVLSAIYAAAIDTDGVLEDAELILFTNEIDEDDVLVVGDLIQPTYTGYAAQALTGMSVEMDVESKPYVQAAALEFSPTNATNLPMVIRGAGIIDTDGVLVAVSNFAAPKNLVVADQVLTVLPKFRLGDRTLPEIVASVE